MAPNLTPGPALGTPLSLAVASGRVVRIGAVTRRIKSDLLRGFLSEARALWKRKDVTAATERAARVFLVEGREVFGAADKPLFDAMLARLNPPQGFATWDAWFAHEERTPTPRDDRTDSQVIADIERKRGRLAIHTAADAGDLARVEQELARGTDVNAVFSNGSLRWTPLCGAVLGDHLAIVQKLLAAGAKVSGAGITSAIFGVKSVPVAELLLASGARLDESDAQGRTTFARVVDVCGPAPMARFLADHSPKPTPAQRQVLLGIAEQATPELRAIVTGFLDGTTKPTRR